MMCEYVSESVVTSESACGKYLRECLSGFGLSVCPNNDVNDRAVDIRVEGGGSRVLVDGQYSTEFGRYGDIRVDAVSAFFMLERFSGLDGWGLGGEICNGIRSSDARDVYAYLGEYLDVRKWGKCFECRNESCEYVMYLVYDGKLPKGEPDKLVVLRVSVVREYVEKKWRELIGGWKFKLNCKSLSTGKGDVHGSAFWAISLKVLEEQCKGGVWWCKSSEWEEKKMELGKFLTSERIAA